MSDDKDFHTLQEIYQNSVHEHVSCSHCRSLPILGLRLKCTVCDDFDLCAACFRTQTSHRLPHSPKHKMLIVTRSSGDLILENKGLTVLDLGGVSEKAAKSRPKSSNHSRDETHSKPIIECGMCQTRCDRGYIYQCLICENLMLCSLCFEYRKSDSSHSSAHPMIRFENNHEALHMYSRDLHGRTFTLDSFKLIFKNSIHTDTKCCWCKKQIRGLRFECDQCYEYDLCTGCFEADRKSQKHKSEHSMIVFGRPQRCEVTLDEIELLECLGQGAFGKVHRARHLPTDRIVACKIIDTANGLMNVMELKKSFFREIKANREIKVNVFFNQNFILDLIIIIYKIKN